MLLAIWEKLWSPKPQGGYFFHVLPEILQGLAGGTSGAADSTFGGGQELLRGNLFAHLYGPNAHGGGKCCWYGRRWCWCGCLNMLTEAAWVVLPRAKSCLAVLLMLAVFTLHADLAGGKALNALATPLALQELYPYTHQFGEVVLLPLTVRNAHGDRLLVLDTDTAVALYLSIHDPRHHASSVGSVSR